MIKKRPNTAISVSFVLALGIVPLAPAHAQALVSALPDEPPSSLFAARLGDSDVEAFAQGFWESWIRSKGSWSTGSEISGFNAEPFSFMQTPDLYAFLSFRERWLFEAYVTQQAPDARFSLSFEGGEDDTIRFARLGNADIIMPAYPYMSFGSPEASFGVAVSAYDRDHDASLDAMLRWDGLEWRTRTFFGGAEALETIVAASDELRGRRFALPDRPVTAVALSVDSPSGARIMQPDEYSASLADGVLLLNAEPSGTLTVEYQDESGAGHSLDLYEFGVDDDGSTIRVYNQYEVRNLYAIPDTATARQLFVRNLATGTTDTRFEVTRVAVGLVEVVKGGADPDPAADAYARPFADEAPWVYEEENSSTAYAGSAGFSIVARGIESVDTIVLESQSIAGTITVYRDDVESSAFQYDEDSHELFLTPPPRSGEYIRVRYAVSSADRSNGALAFGLGGTFPWLGLDWSTALGGRWPLSGAGYDEGGQLSSSWTGVSVGLAMERKYAAFEAATMLRYSRAGTYGVYRVVGMEDYGTSDWLLPFRPADGVDAGITVSVAVDEELGLLDAFAPLIATLHPDAVPNRALVLEAGSSATGDPVRFVRYVEYAPLSSFGTMAFFVQTIDPSPGSTLEIAVGNGVGDEAVLQVALDGLGAGWHKVELSLGPLAALTVTASDGSLLAVPGSTGSFSLPDAAGLVELTVTGLQHGTVLIDEIVLEDETEGFGTLANATFFIGDREQRDGFYLSGAANTAVATDVEAAASLEAGWNSGVAELMALATPSYDGDESSLGLGYVVAIPSKTSPTRIVDEFYRDQRSSRFARDVETHLALGRLRASASSTSAEDSGSFSQLWQAKTAYGTLVSSSASASLTSSGTMLEELDAVDAWQASWTLMTPALEASANNRKLEGAASIFGSALTASVSRSYDASSPGGTAMMARAGVPLRLGVLSLEPYYFRESSVEKTSAAASFAADLAEFAGDTSAAADLWSVAPVLELWSAYDSVAFENFSAEATAAVHEAGAGIELRRPLGYGLLDLFVPAETGIELTRGIERRDDTSIASTALMVSVSGGAANVFASGGAVPLLPALAFDEYSYRTVLDGTWYQSDGAFLPSV
ncbi:MAG: hypothetical protein JXM71_02560, partial [Spirochaetales bacterium]|nr:hypothetical protein [Spirochaetales bacterium]